MTTAAQRLDYLLADLPRRIDAATSRFLEWAGDEWPAEAMEAPAIEDLAVEAKEKTEIVPPPPGATEEAWWCEDFRRNWPDKQGGRNRRWWRRPA